MTYVSGRNASSYYSPLLPIERSLIQSYDRPGPPGEIWTNWKKYHVIALRLRSLLCRQSGRWFQVTHAHRNIALGHFLINLCLYQYSEKDWYIGFNRNFLSLYWPPLVRL